MGRIVTGFIAGMLAVLVFHQPVILLMKSIGMLPAAAQVYNMNALPNGLAPVAAFFKSLGFAGWPVLFNQLFWGGLIGAVFGLIQHRLPGGAIILRGFLYGLLVVVVSNWILLPLIKGFFPPVPANLRYFAGFDPQAMLRGALIQAAFGTGIGLFYSLLRRNR